MLRVKVNSYPLVSVVIPTYNRKDVVIAAIGSVVKQEYKNFELIVVDDGSADGTKECIERMFPDIMVVRQENKGVSSARNLGIENARGDYIAFLDSDDRWMPNKLLRQVEYIRKYPEYAICHTEEIWYRNNVRVNPMQKHQDASADLFAKSLRICIISTSSVLIKKMVFDDIGLYDNDLVACEDYDLWIRITAKYKVLFLAEKLVVKYGGSGDQLSKKYWGMDRFRIKSMEKLLLSGSLDEQRVVILKEVLQEKLKIFIKGAMKHDNFDGVKKYKKKYYEIFGTDSFYNSINV